MSISIFKKAAALLCGAFTAVSLSAVLSASASGAATFKAEQVEAEAGAEVQYKVSLENNPGYSALGLPLTIDSRLTVKGVDGYTIPEDQFTLGSAAFQNGVLNYNPSKNIVAFSCSGTSDKKTSGELYTITVIVPSDAKPGDKYELKFLNDAGEAKVKQFVDGEGTALEYTLADGWIQIEEGCVTGTPECLTGSPESKTTTSATTTSISQEPTTTELDTDTDTETMTTTTVEGTEDTGASDSTSNGNGGSDVPGPKAGETGVALALAGLLTAAAAAYAIRRKH